jgi:hypothetical protein
MKFIDDKGRILFICDGISNGQTYSVYCREPSGSLKRHSGFALHSKRIDAERELIERAGLKGWEKIPV